MGGMRWRGVGRGRKESFIDLGLWLTHITTSCIICKRIKVWYDNYNYFFLILTTFTVFNGKSDES